MKELIKELCMLPGISGREDAVRDRIIELIKDYAEVKVDPVGNVIAFVRGEKRAVKKIMVDAHMDEVGFIITSVSKDGTLKFETVGGIETSALMFRRVILESGAVGVIGGKPIHLIDREDERKLPKADSLYIDIGAASKEDAEKKVCLGDFAVFDEGITDMGDCLLGKAIDDRAGCAAIIDIIRNKPEYDFYATFTTREEIGGTAGCAAFGIEPDYGIVVESTTASDIRDVPDDRKVCRVGEGAVISFMDRTNLYDHELFKTALSVADKKGIKCQVKSVVAGGNNAGKIARSGQGVKAITVSVPCRYIHSAGSVAREDDIIAVRNMVASLIGEFASKE